MDILQFSHVRKNFGSKQVLKDISFSLKKGEILGVAGIAGSGQKELCEAIDFAYENETDKPVLILCDTVKGCGIDFIEGDFRWHYGAFDDAKYEQGKKALENSYAARVARVEKEAE